MVLVYNYERFEGRFCLRVEAPRLKAEGPGELILFSQQTAWRHVPLDLG